jgi:hypothetical protein
MAEKSSPVFVVATANAIDKLPPELLRKGRFDELFVLNLPEAEERRQILNLHLRRRRPQHLSPEPRQRDDYGQRQIEAAHRVLVDLGQVLACFKDSLVVVGGWTPDLLLPDAEERHIGSIDVDLALDASKLGEGLYAELIQLLLDTRRYRPGEKEFQLAVDVDLEDGGKPVLVEVDFLAAQNVKWKKNKPKLLEGFRVLTAEGCNVAFHAPVEITIPGRNVRGAANTVHMRVVSLADFVLMKAHAIGGRDKPKDVYEMRNLISKRRFYLKRFKPETVQSS